MNFRVHHKSTAGVLIQLPAGGFGRVTKQSCGGGVLADRLMQHLSAQRDEIVCAPTGEADEDGYQVYSTDLLRTASNLRWTPHKQTAELIADLAKRNAICGLGRQCRARVVAEKDEGSILKLSDGHTAVALEKITTPAPGPSAAVDDEDAEAGPRHVTVRVLAYDERGQGLVSCSVNEQVAGMGHFSYDELVAAAPTHSFRAGMRTRCKALLSTSVTVGGTTHRLTVASLTSNAASTGVGHDASTAEASKDVLVYVVIPEGTPFPTVGKAFDAQLTYVPPTSMIVATPFCLAVIADDAKRPAPVGAPASRVLESSRLLRPDVMRFPWRDPAVNAAEEAGEGEGDEVQQKLRRRRLEEEIDRLERQGEVKPTSPDEFEKQLLATPYNSYIWTQFMAFHTALRRVDAARTVAERALARIPVSEPKELLNIWVAYLNLENTYGTAESLAQVFRRALERNDDTLVVHERLADIFSATGKKQQLAELCKSMTSKFRKKPAVWERYGKALVDNGQRAQLKRVFRDMSAAIPQREQTLVVVHIAIHEYKHGQPEQGRAHFESLVARAPKRSDVWSAYLDQERALLARAAPEASVPHLRHVFERVATVSLPPKVMQSVLTQWLSFEQANGTATTVQSVKDKARAYVESRAAATASAIAGNV